MSELPDGWAQSSIGDVAESMKNGIYKKKDAYADDGVACLRMYNIEAGSIVWRTSNECASPMRNLKPMV